MEITKSNLPSAINALKQCAKEHKNDTTDTGAIIVSSICEDVARYLESLNVEPEADVIKASEHYADHTLAVADPKIAESNYSRRSKMGLQLFSGADIEVAFLAGQAWYAKKLLSTAISCHIDDGCFAVSNYNWFLEKYEDHVGEMCQIVVL